MTTERDRQMADWLKFRFILPPSYIEEMFAAKSQFTKPLIDVFLDEFAVFSGAGYRLVIVQLEIVRAFEFVNKNLAEIKNILAKLKLENHLNFIFLSCIDVREGCNEIVVVDDQTKRLLQDVLEVKFENGIGKREEVIMRKEILPLLMERFNSKI